MRLRFEGFPSNKIAHILKQCLIAMKFKHNPIDLNTFFETR